MLPLITDLFEHNVEAMQLRWVAGTRGGKRPAAPASADVGLDAGDTADLIGYLNIIHASRIHVLGPQEVAFVNRLEPSSGTRLSNELVAGRPPAMFITDDLPVPKLILSVCEREQVPLFVTPYNAARVIDWLRTYLSKVLAQTVSLHGVFMDVLGMGVLISGDSGLGKSELGLELVSRGHGLVADDVVDLSRIAPNIIEGRCPPILQNLLEVRGLGLLDIKTIFGETAVRRKMRLKLIVHLVRRSTMENSYERLPLEAQSQDVLGTAIRKVIIPVAAGRNLAVLTEAAVRNSILQLRGIDSTQQFLERQRQQMDH